MFRALDGTWTPYFALDPVMFFFLELITVVVEFGVFFAYNNDLPKEKQRKKRPISLLIGVPLVLLEMGVCTFIEAVCRIAELLGHSKIS